MFLRDLYENHSQEVVAIFSGRFQPFHLGHAEVFRQAQAKFGDQNCFIVMSDKQDQVKSPFDFKEKKQMIVASGINPDRVVKVKNPYQAEEVYKHYDPDSTVLTYILGKDKDRFDLDNGSFKELPEDINEALPFAEQKYVYIIPEYEFTVMNVPVTDATELRGMYKKLNNKEARVFIRDLYGEFDQGVSDILDNKLSRELTEQLITEAKNIMNEIPMPGSKASIQGKLHEPRNPVTSRVSTARVNSRWGNRVYPGNKGVLVKMYYKLAEIITHLKKLDPNKDHDAESMNEVLHQLRTIREKLQAYKQHEV